MWSSRGLVLLLLALAWGCVRAQAHIPVTTGLNVTFNCSTEDSKDISYQWKRIYHETMVDRGFDKVFPGRVFGETTATLKILDVSVEDEGEYACFTNGVATRLFCLTTQGPNITGLIGPKKIIEGEQFMLECVAQNNPDAPNDLIFTWRHNGTNIHDGDSHRFVTSFPESHCREARSILVVMNVTQSDGGLYKCVASNREIIDGASVTTTVTVYYVPELTFRMAQCTLKNIYVMASDVNMLTYSAVGMRDQSFTLVVQAPPCQVNNATVRSKNLSLWRTRLIWTTPEENNAHITNYWITCCIPLMDLNDTCLISTAFPSSTNKPTVDLTDINPDRSYRVTIQAENAAGRGTKSQPYFFNSATAEDASPVNLRTVFVSETGVVLSWQLPDIANNSDVRLDSYSISYTRVGSGVLMSNTTKTSTIAIGGLDSGKTYRFEVSAKYSRPFQRSGATQRRKYSHSFVQSGATQQRWFLGKAE